jgi:hypothetical protein
VISASDLVYTLPVVAAKRVCRPATIACEVLSGQHPRVRSQINRVDVYANNSANKNFLDSVGFVWFITV